MKKPAARLWLLSTLICSLLWAGGCAGHQTRPAKVSPVWCPAPPAPALLRLRDTDHLCSSGNAEKIMKNLSALRAYAEGLETALGCYEAQDAEGAFN